MSFDLVNERPCPHQIFDEQLSLQGASPNFFAILKYQGNGNTNQMQIREFATTNSLTNYSYPINGFTNWSLSGDQRQINFNTLGLGGPGSGVASFADGATLLPTKIYLATYLTITELCPLHDIINSQYAPIQKDINVTPQGRLDTSIGSDKVREEVLKALLTLQGANQFQPSYGSLLSSSIGQKFTVLTQFNLQQSIQSAIDFLIQQQQAQPTIPLTEVILRLNSVTMQEDPTDPRTIRIVISILTGTYTNVTVTFGIVTQ